MNNNFIFLKFFLLSAGIHAMIITIFSFYESSRELAETNVIYFDLVNYQDLSSKKNINIKVERNMKNEQRYSEDKVLKKIYKKEYVSKKANQKSKNSEFVNAKIRTSLNSTNENQLFDNKKKIKPEGSYKPSNLKITPQNFYSEENEIIAQEYYKKNNRAFYKMGTLNNPHPNYPLIARKKGWQGRIVLQVSVDSKGLVEKITILKSSGYEILDNESTNTIKRWKFKPAVIGDKPVNDVLEIPIKFVLDN